MSNALRVAAANDEPLASGYDWARVLLSAVVRNAFGDHPVKIREVCSRGAVLQAAMAPATGSRLLLIRGAVTVVGTVVWSEKGKYCLEFQDTIDPEQLLVLIPAATKVDAPLKALFPVYEEVPGTIAKH